MVFLAADKARLQDLEDAARKYIAWSSILAEKKELNLEPLLVTQAEHQCAAAESAVDARLPETYQWLIAPTQGQDPRAAIKWEAIRLTGQDGLAERASKRLRNDELLLPVLAATRLRVEMDRVPLWRGNDVAIKQLAEDFAKYLYLSRLVNPEVLLNAVRGGLSLLTWERDSFAYAESFDAAEGWYKALSCGQHVPLAGYDSPGLLVRPEVARAQMDAEAPAAAEAQTVVGTGTIVSGPGVAVGPTAPPEPPKPKRFHGSAVLNAARAGRDASVIADEVIGHLTALVGANVTVTLEIEAEVPKGVPENVVRTVTENCRTLKFKSQGFEAE